MRSRWFIVAGLVICLVAPAISQDVRNTYIQVAAQVADGILTNAKLANMANSTLKCRTTAGTGAPEDCTAAQAATIIGTAGGALKSKAIHTTYDLTTATGTQAITGFGFTPTTCTVYAGTSSITSYTAAATSDSTKAATGYYVTAGVFNEYGNTTNFIILADATTTNFQIATIQSYDADGLTLSWTKTAAPTGTAAINLTCFR